MCKNPYEGVPKAFFFIYKKNVWGTHGHPCYGSTMGFHFGSIMGFHFGNATRFHFGTATRFHFGSTTRYHNGHVDFKL